MVEATQKTIIRKAIPDGRRDLAIVLRVLGRVNVLVVPLLALVIFATSMPRGPGNLLRILAVAAGLSNLTCVAIAAVFLLGRRMVRAPGTAHEVLALVLPSLPTLVLTSMSLHAVLGMIGRWGLIPADTGLAAYSIPRLLSVTAPIALLFGAGLWRAAAEQQRIDHALAALHASRLRQRDLSLQRQTAEMARLRSLVRPHFLFNALNTLTALIREDPERAESMTLALSRHFRQALQVGEAETVSLRSELDAAADYLSIEQHRFGDQLWSRIDCPDELAGIALPGMLLLPLVENAVKHGASQSEGRGEVEILVRAEGDTVRIEIRDNGPGFASASRADEPVGSEGGSGMRLVREQLALHYKGRALLGALRDETLQRTIVVLELPCEELR